MTDPRKPFADALRGVGLNFNRAGVIASFDAMLDAGGIPRASQAVTGRTTSKAGLDLIKSFESCAKAIGGGRFEAYPDPAPGNNGLPVTIGWGSTRDFDGKPIKLGTVWTQEQCDRKKAEDMAVFERDVSAMIGNTPTTQGQYDALVSLCYNIGQGNLRTSTLMRKHRAKDYDGAADEFARWTRAGGQVLRGLVRRRAAEAALYRGEA